MAQSKTVFEFNKSIWKRLVNRFDNTTRVFTCFFLAIMLGSVGTLSDGVRNSGLKDTKEKWIKTAVRNLDNREFSKLDEEDLPIPLNPRTPVEQFKAEFSKIV